jgi:hypothetical protein
MMQQRQEGHAAGPNVQHSRCRRRHAKHNSVIGSSHEDLQSLDAPSINTHNLVEDESAVGAGDIQSQQQANNITCLLSNQTKQPVQTLNQSPFHTPLGYSPTTAGSSPPQPDSPTGLSSTISGNSSSYAGYFRQRLLTADHYKALGDKLQAASQTGDISRADTGIAQT